MEKLLLFLNSIDWLFLAVIVIGGRVWGRKYFQLSKNSALNFLAFASVFAAIWVLILWVTGNLKLSDLMNLFITYLFATSFYELLGKGIFERLEGLLGIKGTEY